jgi:hypothetical protein
MKLSQTKLALLILVLVLPSALSGCILVNRIRAKNALNEGAKAYKEGRFGEAQQKFEQAYSLDPEQKNTPYLIARSIHGQYRPGVDDDANKAKAEEAIKAYENVLNNSDANQRAKDDAYEAIITLFHNLKESKRMDEWLMQRAKAENVAAEKRADAYTVLASKQATCSNDITEANRKEENRIIVYVMPASREEFDKAAGCTEEGMKLIKEALDLNDRSAEAWKIRRDLLLEKMKLAQMEKKPVPEILAIESEAKDAHSKYEERDAEAKQKKAEEDAKKEKKA